MMPWWEVIVLAVIQAITEFLPISSSGHLVLPSLLFGWMDQGLDFDIALHVGSLIATITYFRRDIRQLLCAGWQSLRDRQLDSESRLAWGLLLSTIPAGLVGLAFNDYVEENFRSLLVIASTMMLFGVLLGWADRANTGSRSLVEAGWCSMILIGVAQVFALVPGTSRSGVTMTAARFLGFSREASARFSFLMAIPLIGAIGLVKTLELLTGADPVHWQEILIGTAVSAFVAFFVIRWFMAFVVRVGFMPFVIYRIILSLVLLVIYFQAA